MSRYKVFLASKYEASRLQDDDYLEKVKSDFNEMAGYNTAVFKELNNQWNQIVSLVIAVYGKDTVVHRYIFSRKPEKPPDNWGEFNKLLKKYNAWHRKEEKRLEEIRQREERLQRERDYRERRKKAIDVLVEQDYVPDEHFPRGRAITFAKQVIYQLPDGTIAPRALPPGEPNK